MTVGLERLNEPVSMARKAGKLRVVTGSVNMDEWLLCLCQKYDVEIVKSYKQKKDPAMLRYDWTSDGWCHGMVIDWLRCKRNGIDFWESFNSDSGKHRVRFLMARQAISYIKETGTGFNSRYRTVMSSTGLALLTFERKIDVVQKVRAADLADSLLRVPGRYVYFSIAGLGGAHSMGFLRSQTQVVFMDPNEGEFVFPKESVFRPWLSKYLKLKEYKLLRMRSSYSVHSFG